MLGLLRKGVLYSLEIYVKEIYVFFEDVRYLRLYFIFILLF